MKVVARRLQGFAHEVDIEGGHTIVVDEPAGAGGTDTGPSPAACSPPASPPARR